MAKSEQQERHKGITATSTVNISLHANYLGFAIHASLIPQLSKRPMDSPVSRSIVDAIRFSFDSIDASTEYMYHLLQGDHTSDSWLTRYVDRGWRNFKLPDRIGLLTFSRRGESFWQNEAQHGLFQDLKHVRNALTHPALFRKTVETEYPDFHAEPTSTKTTIEGKMKKDGKSVAGFAEHPEDLSIADATKAVEIALRHAMRFEELMGAKDGSILFGAINAKSGEKRSAAQILSEMSTRHFDVVWTAKETTTRLSGS